MLLWRSHCEQGTGKHGHVQATGIMVWQVQRAPESYGFCMFDTSLGHTLSQGCMTLPPDLTAYCQTCGDCVGLDKTDPRA